MAEKEVQIKPVTPAGFLKAEWFPILGIATAAIFLTIGATWVKDLSNPLWATFQFIWIFGAMLGLSFAVVRHADALAAILGEPYGTLILTLSVIAIEVVVISAVMLTGESNPSLARDSMFAVLMIVLNGMLGVTLLLGGLKHKEQSYNVKGATTYLTLIIALAGIGLILPRFTYTTPGGYITDLMSIFLIVSTVLLYGIFLVMQTTRHSSFFKPVEGEAMEEEEDHGTIHPPLYHAVMLLLSMVPIVLLSKKLAVIVDHGITILGAPAALAGILVAALVLAPEMLAACKSALANNLQRTVNISLGSALATIGLTIPSILGLSAILGKHIELGLEPWAVALLSITLLVTVVNMSGRRTNVLVGAVHLVLLLTYVVLIFE